MSGSQDITLMLAQVAKLELAPDRVEAVSPYVEGLQADYDALRGLALELEPHIVFDPRWD
jgi:hypothetical protein